MTVREPESQFGPPAPAGVHAAVCVDEIDMGLVANRFDPAQDPAPTVRLVWQIAEDDKEGKPFLVKKDYRASLHEKANLRHDLESWRGGPFTFDELVGFDLENVVGAHAMINVVDKISKKGKKFTNVAAIMPLAKGMAKLAPRDYVRVKDRPAAPSRATADKSSAVNVPPPYDFEGINDDDIPF